MEERWTAAIFDQFLLEDLGDMVLRDLAEHRYLEASVETRITLDEASNVKTVVVRAEPGQALTTLETISWTPAPDRFTPRVLSTRARS